jgi:hypothetical protein
MAASAWQLYNSGKRYIGNGTITLGAGSFKMALLNSASNTSTFTLSTFASLTGQISATGGYVSGGKELVPATGQWTVGASAKQMKFTYSTVGLTFTASGSALTNVKYAVLTFGASAAVASARKLLVLLPAFLKSIYGGKPQYVDSSSCCNWCIHIDLRGLSGCWLWHNALRYR